MPAIPLGIQAYNRTDGFVPEVELLNLIIEKDENGISADGVLRLQRPSLTRTQKLPMALRGLFRQDGVLNGASYAVSGVQLYSYTSASYSLVGVVGGTDRVEWAATYFGLYCLGGGQPYYTDGGTVTPIAMPDGRLVQSIDTLDSYILLFCSDGRFYWIVPGQITVDPLNFATAESSPDGGVAVRRLVDEAWFFGALTVEPWQATGNADAPFQRASGRVYDRGCLSRDAVYRFDNGIIWIGEDGIVYRTSNVPQAVSTPAIEERIRKASDDVSAFTFESNGHKFYVLKIPGQGDFAYDARSTEWSKFASPNSDSWLPAFGYQMVAGSGVDGVIWAIDPDVAVDDGLPYRKAISGTVPLGGKPVRQSSASVNVGCSAATTFRLRWRDADEDFPDYWEEFEVEAGASTFDMYRMGQIRSPFRTFEIDNIEAVRIRIADASLNDSWQ
jgi:hypothetical protein